MLRTIAGGRSSRMGRNKLLLDLDGKPILCHAVDQALGRQLARATIRLGTATLPEADLLKGREGS